MALRRASSCNATVPLAMSGTGNVIQDSYGNIINWADIGAIKAKTDTINWTDVGVIKAATNTSTGRISAFLSQPTVLFFRF